MLPSSGLRPAAGRPPEGGGSRAQTARAAAVRGRAGPRAGGRPCGPSGGSGAIPAPPPARSATGRPPHRPRQGSRPPSAVRGAAQTLTPPPAPSAHVTWNSVGGVRFCPVTSVWPPGSSLPHPRCGALQLRRGSLDAPPWPALPALWARQVLPAWPRLPWPPSCLRARVSRSPGNHGRGVGCARGLGAFAGHGAQTARGVAPTT